MLNHTIVAILAYLAMFIGLAGIFLPFLPGVPVAWIGLFAYAYYDGFIDVTPQALFVFGILTLLTFAIDFLAPVLGAKFQKSSGKAAIGSLVGGVLGVFVMGPFGIVVGPLIGAFVGEMIEHKDPQKALRSALGAFFGFLISSFIKGAIVSSMILYLAVKMIF